MEQWIYGEMSERDLRMGEWNSGIYREMSERDLRMGEWNSGYMER